jgi:hypothetical protein
MVASFMIMHGVNGAHDIIVELEKVIGIEVLTPVVMNSSVFWNILPPACFILVSCLAYSSTLKMEKTCFETSVYFNGIYGVISRISKMINYA